MHIDCIKESLEDIDEYELGLVDENHLLQWVKPVDVQGLNSAVCRKINKAKSKGQGLEDEGDDEQLAEYLYQSKLQRASYARSRSQPQYLVSEMEYLDALLHLTEIYWTDLDFTTVNREVLNLSDYSNLLEKVMTRLKEIDEPFVKKNLISFTYNVFCYGYVSPALENYPELQHFLAEPTNTKLLESLSK